MVRRVLLSITLMFWSSMVWAQLSEKEFTASYFDIVLKSYPAATIKVIEPLQLTISFSQRPGITVNLDNAYHLYVQDPEQLDSVLAHYSATLVDSMVDKAATLSVQDIVPVVKDSTWLDDMSAAAIDAGAKTAPEFFYEVPANGLVTLYAEDTPTSIRYMTRERLTDAGMDLTALKEQALENLLRRLPDIEKVGGEGLYMVAAGGDYEASLLLVDSMWTATNFQVKGDIVVSVPARDTLLVSGSKDVENLKKLRELSNEIFSDSTYHVSSGLFVRRDGEWLPFIE